MIGADMANSIHRGLRRGIGLAALAALAALTACGAPPAANSPASASSPPPPSAGPPAAVSPPPAAAPTSSAGPAGSATPPPPHLQPTVGVNAVVRNTVTTRGFGETAQHPSTPQGPVRFLDQIATGDAAQLKVVFNDQTDLSLGADTRLSVDRFVNDPSPGVTGVGVAVVRGVFRFASRRPGEEQESFRTPTAAIGVRGTMFDAAVGPLALDIVGDDVGGLSLADDPATAALIVLRQGVIEVRTAERIVTLRRPGQAVVVSGRHVSDPFYPAPGDDRRLLGRLPPLAGYPGAGPGDFGPRRPVDLGGAPSQPYTPRPYPRGADQPLQPPAGAGQGRPTGQPVVPGGYKPSGASNAPGPGARPPATSDRATTNTTGSAPGQTQQTAHQPPPGGYRIVGPSTAQPATTTYRPAAATSPTSSQPLKFRPVTTTVPTTKPASVGTVKKKPPAGTIPPA